MSLERKGLPSAWAVAFRVRWGWGPGKGQQPQREDLPLRQKWSREGVQKAWEKAVEGLHWQRRQIGAASWPADWGSSRTWGQAGPFRFLLWTGGVCVGNCFLSATLRQQCCFSFLEETAAASCQDPRGIVNSDSRGRVKRQRTHVLPVVRVTWRTFNPARN